MKIVFALDCANIVNNGTGATCLRFAEELRKRGHQVILLGAENDDGKEHKDYVGLKHYHFPIFQGLIEKEGFMFPCAEIDKIYEAVEGADIVHLFLPFKMENTARLIAESLDIPVTGAFHLQPQNITSAIHMGKLKFINECLYFSFRKYMYDQIRHIHCPSQMTADELSKHHYSRNKTWAISNGISSFFYPIDVARPEQYKDKFIITMTGRLAGEKRQDLIIRAIAKSKYNDRIQLVLAGQGPTLHRLRKLSKKVGLKNEPVISFFNQSDLRDLLNCSDLYIHASDFESEGIGCIEAFACGAVPLISDARLSATNHFSLDNEHCLFKHGSSKDLAEKIDWFVEHPEEKEALRKRYIEYATSFALPKQVDQMEIMLEEAILDKKEGKDLPTLYPSKKDRRKSKRIFKRLIKMGVVKEMPAKLK